MMRLTDVNRVFDVGEQKVYALRDVNLSIEAGEYASIMGPSGSGKSTLLNIMGLLDRPTSGSYQLSGHETADLPDDDLAHIRQSKIGFIFQFFHLIPRLTAAENVELPMVLAGLEKAERQQRTEEALRSVGILDRAHHHPDQLSGGQRQRAAIARAVVMQPDVILADEPTGNLDQKSGLDVIGIMESLNQQGITLLIITHDAELGKRAPRKIKMIDGKIV